MTEPTQEQWRILFQTAEEFRQLAPWRWMTGDELFAVEDPATGEVGYGIVMGSGGQEFGLSEFLGAEGFESYRKLMAGEVEPESFEGASIMRAVAVSFGPREVLGRRDHEIIRSLGLRFRGRDVWPWFRSQRPGYGPWYLDSDEAGLLEVALRQGMEVANRVKAGELRLTDGVKSKPVFTRCFREGAWVDEWRVPPVWKASAEERALPDPERLRRLQQTKPKGRDRWQFDLSLVPALVGERGERPYYPLMLMAINQQGFILGNDLLEPWATAAERQEAVVRLLERAPNLPQEIHVGREDVRRLLEPTATALGITVRRADLNALEAVKQQLLYRFT